MNITTITNVINTPLFKKSFLTGLFLFLSIIRLHEFDRIPGPAHAEELLYGWSGIYLIETGVPVSWSTLDYPEQYVYFDGLVGNENLGLPAKLFQPWLDEPPLFSLLVGWVSHLYGDDRTQILPTSHTRLPTVFISLVVLGLLFYITSKQFGYWTGIAAMSIYGTSPLMIFASRLSVPENVISLFLLISLILAYAYEQKQRLWIPIMWSIMTLIAGLMKPTGFFIAPICIFLCFKHQQWRHIGILIGSLILGVGAFLAYGYYFNWELFQRIVAIQGGRFAGWTGLPFILTTPAYDIFEFFDGWYVFALITTLALLFLQTTDKFINLLKFFFVYWLVIATFGSTEQDLLPWYWYPIMPLISIAGAYTLKNIIKKPELFHLIILVGLLFSSRFYLHNDFRPQTNPWVFRISFFILVLPSLLYHLYPKKVFLTLTRGTIIIILLLGTYLNSKYVYNAFSLKCENISCPLGPSTIFTEARLPFIWRFFIIGDPPETTTARGF